MPRGVHEGVCAQLVALRVEHDALLIETASLRERDLASETRERALTAALERSRAMEDEKSKTIRSRRNTAVSPSNLGHWAKEFKDVWAGFVLARDYTDEQARDLQDYVKTVTWAERGTRATSDSDRTRRRLYTSLEDWIEAQGLNHDNNKMAHGVLRSWLAKRSMDEIRQCVGPKWEQAVVAEAFAALRNAWSPLCP